MHDLSRGSEDLETAYNEVVKRIEAQPVEHQALARRVISWITYAKRPLSLIELQLALAVETGTSEMDEDNIPGPDENTSVCAGLLAIDEESNIIRLVHYTTEEYFGRIRLSWMPNGDSDIAITCLTYLSFDIFGAGSDSADTDLPGRSSETSRADSYYWEFEDVFSSNPFLDCAVYQWGSHARLTTDKSGTISGGFLGG